MIPYLMVSETLEGKEKKDHRKSRKLDMFLDRKLDMFLDGKLDMFFRQMFQRTYSKYLETVRVAEQFLQTLMP